MIKRIDTSKLRDSHALGLLLLLGLFHAIYNVTLELHPDEAYYWYWSKKLQLSYFDHPPMIAYMIRIFTLFSDHEFFTRLTAVFCMSVTGWYIFKLAKDVYDKDVAWLSLISYTIIPTISMGYTIITPDAPLLMFWALSTWYCYKALFEGKWKDYLLAGLFIGAMMLSKYTSVLFLTALLLFIIIKMPRHLLQLKPWAAIILAFIIFLPAVYWNYQHDWISFTFQYKHGTAEEVKIEWNKFFEFIGGLFAIFTPIFFGILIYGSVKVKNYWSDKKRFFIAITYLFPLLFFTYKGLFKKMELNWVAVAFISGIILFSWTVKEYKLKKTFIAGAALAILLNLILHFPALFFLPPKMNIHNRIYGVKEAALRAASYLEPGDLLLADHLRRAAMFSFYAGGARQAHIPSTTRFSQYTMWDKDIDFSKVKGVFLSKRPEEKELSTIFKKVELLEKVKVKKEGLKEKTFYIYRCGN